MVTSDREGTPAPREPGRRGPGAGWLLLFLGLLLVAAIAIEKSPRMRPTADALRARAVEQAAFGAGDTARILQNLGLVNQLPPGTRPGGTEVLGPGARSIRRGGWQPLASILSVDPLDETQLATILAFDPEWLDGGLPILSLQMRDEDLARLEKNPNGRGREYEEEAFVAYLVDGDLVYSSGAGLRVHGGKTREYARLRSYRLHFRSRYGQRRFSTEVFPSRSDYPPRSVVIGNNLHGLDERNRRWQFVEPMAYDFVRRIGMPAPATSTAIFFLNGQNRGSVNLTEYVDADYLEAHYGHDRFVLVRSKLNPNSPAPRVKQGDRERYEELVQWLRSTPEPTMDQVARVVDIDNLSRWFLGIVFCATGDVFNGPLLLDETDPEARWFWVAWDLEFSFGQPRFPPDQAGPERDTIPFVLHRRHRRDPRSALLQGLFATSPEFRAYFADLATEALNHRLTDEFLQERLAFYRDQLDRAPVRRRDFWTDVEAFVLARKPILRRQLAQHFGYEPSHRVTVENPNSAHLIIDGHALDTTYQGWYFEGQHIEIDAPLGETGFEIAGRRTPGPALSLEVTGETKIRLIEDG